MKRALLLLPLLFLACASPVATLQVPTLAKSEGTVVKDLRPANEKTNEMFSLMVTSEAYGLYRKGDESHVPTAIRLFQHRAFEKLGAEGKPLEITVHHFAVYLNMKSQLRSSAAFGVIGAGLASKNKVTAAHALADAKAFENVGKDEYKRALFTEQENPEKASAFVIYIDAEVGGKRVFTRSLVPLAVAEGKVPHTEALEAAIGYFLSQL